MLGDYHDRPRPKHEPDFPATEVRVKEKGTNWERNRYVGRSDPAQTSYYEVSIKEPLSIPVRVTQVRDPPLFGDRRFPDRHLELNLGSVERMRELYEALGAVLEEYDHHETSENDE
ncbi:hypothetical protein [Natronorubrum aibiense]|uniref:Uncharacterized protein n=1 Tax=Natronorubrum aibiense TaxID=348826 RepID=A0A5P9P926_9EURY|nr:hypothetical protein [Natronorubrum aibiense]QFU84497.1 hypothetical protein GCU68_18405 [Natronorubrum aibiense]